MHTLVVFQSSPAQSRESAVQWEPGEREEGPRWIVRSRTGTRQKSLAVSIFEGGVGGKTKYHRALNTLTGTCSAFCI